MWRNFHSKHSAPLCGERAPAAVNELYLYSHSCSCCASSLRAIFSPQPCSANYGTEKQRLGSPVRLTERRLLSRAITSFKKCYLTRFTLRANDLFGEATRTHAAGELGTFRSQHVVTKSLARVSYRFLISPRSRRHVGQRCRRRLPLHVSQIGWPSAHWKILPSNSL